MTAAQPQQPLVDRLAEALLLVAHLTRAVDEAREIITEQNTVLDDRMTTAGHPYALILSEHRGVCPPYEDSVRCRTYRELFVRAMTWLRENEPSVMQQLELVEAS